MEERRRTPGDLMTPEQVAEYLQLHKLTIYKYIREGRLPAARLGRSLRIAKADVERFLEERRAGPPVPARAQAETRGGIGGRREPQPSRPATTPAPVPKHSDEIYVGPSRSEGKSRDAVVNVNPIDWVVRGLH